MLAPACSSQPFCSASSASPASQAIGQEATPLTPFQKQLNRFDLAVSADGIVSSDVSGIEKRDAASTHNNLLISPSSTVGELITLRYVAKPLAGFEFNFGNSRYTQNFTFTPPLVPSLLHSAQTGVREITFGYVAHTPSFHGVQPYLGAGGGTIRFKPTPNGGEGLPFQYRAAYYYNFGVEQNFTGAQPLRRPRRFPPAYLSRARLPHQLPHHHPPHPHQRAHLRLLPPLLKETPP